MANLHNIYLRTGCFCNPGACQRHLKLRNDELKANYQVIILCCSCFPNVKYLIFCFFTNNTVKVVSNLENNLENIFKKLKKKSNEKITSFSICLHSTL